MTTPIIPVPLDFVPSEEQLEWLAACRDERRLDPSPKPTWPEIQQMAGQGLVCWGNPPSSPSGWIWRVPPLGRAVLEHYAKERAEC